MLLILDNAPRNAKEFDHDAIKVIYFPKNVTSWKQPTDMAIIAILKKEVQISSNKRNFDMS